MLGEEADKRRPVCRPRTAAEARREVEFALYPLSCSPDAHYRSAHLAGVWDATLIASEIVGHVLHHRGDLSRDCFLVCTLQCGEITITVTDPCDDVLPASPIGPDARRGGLEGAGWWLVHHLADQVDIVQLPGGGRSITAAVPLSGP
ncbi:ATP-binding protein [Streptomyces sp. NPDC091406]|uniref:ATP-binding protein n=1 Tax=unclassified Streptomyces TaxID=2593676 RepID=UPI0038286C74